MKHLRFRIGKFTVAEHRLIRQFGGGDVIDEGNLKHETADKANKELNAKAELEKSLKAYEQVTDKRIGEGRNKLTEGGIMDRIGQITAGFDKRVAPHNKRAQQEIDETGKNISRIRSESGPNRRAQRPGSSNAAANEIDDAAVELFRDATLIGAIGPHERTQTRGTQRGRDVTSDERETDQKKLKAETSNKEAAAKDLLVFAPANTETSSPDTAAAAKQGTETLAKAADDQAQQKTEETRKFETGRA